MSCLFAARKKRRWSMGIRQTKREISHLKDQVKATNRENDRRLLKLVLLMVILAVAAGLMYGKIQLW